MDIAEFLNRTLLLDLKTTKIEKRRLPLKVTPPISCRFASRLSFDYPVRSPQAPHPRKSGGP